MVGSLDHSVILDNVQAMLGQAKACMNDFQNFGKEFFILKRVLPQHIQKVLFLTNGDMLIARVGEYLSKHFFKN